VIEGARPCCSLNDIHVERPDLDLPLLWNNTCTHADAHAGVVAYVRVPPHALHPTEYIRAPEMTARVQLMICARKHTRTHAHTHTRAHPHAHAHAHADTRKRLQRQTILVEHQICLLIADSHHYWTRRLYMYTYGLVVRSMSV